MPVRPRRHQHRLRLTASEYVDLEVGPSWDTGVPFDRYHALYHEWAHLFGTGSWGFRYFEGGIDDREPDELDPGAPVGLPGCND
jgi:hypothetical protein